jgi:dihydroflavonol-4-reductase
VRALVRRRTGAQIVEGLGGTPVIGDLLDPPTLDPGMEGCRVVYHAAGVNALCLRDPDPMFRANVEGSVNVIRAAAASGVQRVVYTSSAAAVGEAAGDIGSEDTPHRGRYLTAYEESKHRAEVAVLEEAARLGIEVVSVNPSSVQGPGRATGTARILIGYLTGRLRFAIDTQLSIVFVDDCVEGHLLAERQGRPGERYLLNGAVLAVRDALAILDGITGVQRRVWFVPPWALRVGARAVGGVSRLLRRDEPPICPEAARALLHGHAYDGSKAARELGLVYTPVEEAFRQTVEWMRRTGLV